MPVEAQTNAALLHWMQELAPYGVFTTDVDLKIRSWNHWLEIHSGRSATKMLGQPLFEVFPELTARKVDEYFRMALEGQVSVLSTALHKYLFPFAPTVSNANFKFMQQTVRIAPLVLNRTICGTVATIEDVTQREIQARALREHALELESNVRERTARLNETVAQLESFSYTVAHDLRAPIRTFKGYADILLEDYGGEFPERARGYVVRMKRAAESMDNLTRDLLQFSRISRQQLTTEPINIERVIEEIVSQTLSLQAPGLLMIHTPLHSVIGNGTLIQQCLANLLNNAVKFVVPSRPLRVVVRSELKSRDPDSSEIAKGAAPFISPVQEETDQEKESIAVLEPRVRIWVEDNGIGIEPEHYRKIFGIFERLQNAREFDGTGIGLAIVARAVQRMNGSCGVESAPSGGSRFWIELPAAVP